MSVRGDSMRRFAAAAAAVLMAFSAAGCAGDLSGGRSTASGEGTEASSASLPDASTLEPVELTWYLFMDRRMRDEAMVMEAINDYLKEKINLTLHLNILIGEDFSAQMPLIIASGQPFDICFTSSWANSYSENVARGAFLEITDDMLDRQAPGLKAAIPERIWDGIRINNRVYGIPTYKETGHQFGYFINADMAERNGLDPTAIHSWRDIEPMYETIRKNEPDVLCNPGDSMYYAALLHEHVTGDWNLPGVLDIPAIDTYADDGGEVINQYETKEYEEYVRTMRQWRLAGYLGDDRTPLDAAGYDLYVAGKEFSFAIYYAPEYEKTFSRTTGVNTVYVPFDNLILETADISGSGLQAISSSSANPGRALMLLDMVNTDVKLGTMLRHGIEGVHYVRVGDQLDRSAVPGIDVKNHPYDYVFGYQFGSPFNQIWDVSYPADIKERFLAYNAQAIPTQAFGFSFDASPVQNGIAGLKSVLDIYEGALNLGRADPDVHLPKMRQALKDNGVDDFLAEVERQIAMWRENR